jgi:hypothetical protein
MNFLLNGTVLYEKPDKLRILGYHPLGMGVFDALYRGGEFFLLVPTEKKAYTGAIADFEDLMERAGVRILTEKTPGIIVPTLVRIGMEQPETRVDLRLKEIDVNSHLPEDAFQWLVPEGADVIPLAQLRKNPEEEPRFSKHRAEIGKWDVLQEGLRRIITSPARQG